MRTILLTIVTFIFATGAFAQSKADLVEKVLEVKNGKAIFTRLTEDNQNIPDAKKAEFKELINKKAEELLNEARNYFMKKYSEEDLEEIYNELNTPGRIALSEKTLGFIREYRSYKIKFQKYFKEKYIAYQR